MGIDPRRGTVSLAIPELPSFARPDVAEFGWALVIGVAALLVGLAVAALAIGYAEGTGKNASDVLFSGQDALGPLVSNSAEYSVGALLALVACKALPTARR
jgi:hypothetical protein